MVRNRFGSHVPSDLLFLEDAHNIEINLQNWFIGSLPL
jgi:hypothetical protein